MSVRAPELDHGAWIAGGPLSLRGLRPRAVLLDFFTFGCINCMNNLPMLSRLQARYGDGLQVIGVHSGKFAHEKDVDAVRAAVARLGITYPVLNDPEGALVDQYAVKAWPTMVLVNAEGYIAATFRGEAQGVAIDLALQKLGLLPREGAAESAILKGPLRFPEAVLVSGEQTFIANSGGGDVREYNAAGRLVRRFTPFRTPAALALSEGMLYIADRAGGSVCRIDLRSEERTVLFEQLRAPSALLVEAETITIAEAGAHTVTVYDKETLRPLQTYGNRFEALRDGAGDAAQLAQPMGMTRCDDGILWFVDAESSALRSIENDHVQTLVGEGLFTWGDADSDPILLQHPQGITCGRIGDGCGGGRLFIADTYNGKLKVYDPQSGRMMTLMEELNEPTGLCKQGCSLYIAESGAHRVIRYDLSSMSFETYIA
ncbi:redoxin domain-containing protein [Sulfurimonas sp. HSL-3221]|uniref:redoxin domain-containing protein n=1 Tax=Sulfurimonadaceae TaxID=2771471 RepID=UPI001E5FF76C|nr:redoxin domain-containing protein [Sulfurimonas sp. HSL-3221]UFS62134.1 redoxin domain-containing protein [Sulfurimonas sp. HSL-3221]